VIYDKITTTNLHRQLEMVVGANVFKCFTRTNFNSSVMGVGGGGRLHKNNSIVTSAVTQQFLK
jgi:hypothetical protein